jgi:hypothetical protein
MPQAPSQQHPPQAALLSAVLPAVSVAAASATRVNGDHLQRRNRAELYPRAQSGYSCSFPDLFKLKTSDSAAPPCPRPVRQSITLHTRDQFRDPRRPRPVAAPSYVYSLDFPPGSIHGSCASRERRDVGQAPAAHIACGCDGQNRNHGPCPP